MSAGGTPVERRDGARRDARPAATFLLVSLGIVALVWRTHLAALPPPTEGAALAVLFGAILAASLLVPAGRGVSRLPAAAVLAAGVAALGLAAVAAGPSVPVPWNVRSALLAVLAAVAEEALFRRAAYAALEPFGAPVAIGATALAFALMHVPLYGIAAFPVDLGAGLLFGWQRWASGRWTVPAATHVAANLMVVIAR